MPHQRHCRRFRDAKKSRVAWYCCILIAGIASCAIIDGKAVSEADIGSNFFVASDELGISRAKCVAQHLHEMNEDVLCDYIEMVIPEY